MTPLIIAALMLACFVVGRLPAVRPSTRGIAATTPAHTCAHTQREAAA